MEVSAGVSRRSLFVTIEGGKRFGKSPFSKKLAPFVEVLVRLRLRGLRPDYNLNFKKRARRKKWKQKGKKHQRGEEGTLRPRHGFCFLPSHPYSILLPFDSQRELNGPRVVGLTGQILQPGGRIRVDVVRMIEEVEEVRRETDVLLLAEPEVLEQRQVHVPGARP